MRKTAQNPFTTPYGQGALAGYGQGGYSTSMDNLGLLPGIEPTQQESYDPGPTSQWKLPAGLVAGGLLASLLLRKGGGRLAAAGESLAAGKKLSGPLTPDQIQQLTRLSRYDPSKAMTTLQNIGRNLPRTPQIRRVIP